MMTDLFQGDAHSEYGVRCMQNRTLLYSKADSWNATLSMMNADGKEISRLEKR